MAVTSRSVSGYLSHQLRHEFDLDDLHVWEDPLNYKIRFEADLFGQRQSFTISTDLLRAVGEMDGMNVIRDQIRRAVDRIVKDSIDLRHHAIESIDDLKTLIDREDEAKPRGAVIISKQQADELVGDNDIFKFIVQDQNTGANTIFGHPFRVYLGSHQ